MMTAIRLILTAAVLAVAWFHSHWSVALTLTGLCAANELNPALQRNVIKALGKRL
jgi:hypothetical protein